MAHAPAPPPIGLAAWLGLSIVATATIVLGLQRPDESMTAAQQPASHVAHAVESPIAPLTAIRHRESAESRRCL